MENLNTSYFLPNRFKRIGWAIIIFHLLLMILVYILHDLMGMRYSMRGFEYLVFPLFQYTLMIGLTFVISSREKKEDEMIRLIRLKSFQYGLYLTVFVSLVLFILSITGNISLRLSNLVGIGEINATLVYIVAIYQFKLFRLRNDEE